MSKEGFRPNSPSALKLYTRYLRSSSLKVFLCEQSIHLPIAEECQGEGLQLLAEVREILELIESYPQAPEGGLIVDLLHLIEELVCVADVC